MAAHKSNGFWSAIKLLIERKLERRRRAFAALPLVRQDSEIARQIAREGVRQKQKLANMGHMGSV